MTNRRRRSATIIEAVAAVVILGVALPPLMQAFGEGTRQSIYPTNATIASFLAIERMEEVIARRFKSSTGYADLTATNFPDESPVSGFSRFNRTVTFSEVTSSLAPSGSAVGYRKARVTVTWTAGGGGVLVIERVFADF